MADLRHGQPDKVLPVGRVIDKANTTRSVTDFFVVEAPATDMGERLAQLKQLGELLSAGVLTQAEFEQQKTRILNG